MLIKPRNVTTPCTYGANLEGVLHGGKPQSKEQLARRVKRNAWFAYANSRASADVDSFFDDYCATLDASLVKDSERSHAPTYLNCELDAWAEWVTARRVEHRERVAKGMDLPKATARERMLGILPKVTLSFVHGGKLHTRLVQLELLNADARNWTTPVARDGIEVRMKKAMPEHPSIPNRMDMTLPRQIHTLHQFSGELNTRWIEALMGLPIGWVLPVIPIDNQDDKDEEK